MDQLKSNQQREKKLLNKLETRLTCSNKKVIKGVHTVQ